MTRLKKIQKIAYVFPNQSVKMMRDKRIVKNCLA